MVVDSCRYRYSHSHSRKGFGNETKALVAYLLFVESPDGRAEGCSPVSELGGALVLAVEVHPTMPVTREDLDGVGPVEWVGQEHTAFSITDPRVSGEM